MLEQTEPLKMTQFYSIYDINDEHFVVEDRTKRGLSVMEKSIDKEVDVIAEKGCIYDGNGRGHIVPIRWYFPKEKYILDEVCKFAEKLDSHYRSIMEDTCPDY
jgi:hypothetical protein